MEVRIGLVLIVEGPEEVHLDLSRIIVTGVNPVEVNPEEEALKVMYQAGVAQVEGLPAEQEQNQVGDQIGPLPKGAILNHAIVAALRAVQDAQQTKDRVIGIKAQILARIENTQGVVVVLVATLPEVNQNDLVRTNRNNQVKTIKETEHNLFIYRYNSLCFGTQMLKNS